MPHEAHSPIGPDAPDALEPQFRIEGAFAVRAVLRELMTRRALVTLYPEDRIDDALVTRIVHVDTDGVEFDASGQARSAQALREARFATGVSFPENVKTQFRLEPLTLEEGPAPPATDSPASAAESAWTTLRTPVPAEVYRLQRRDAFRVRPPAGDDAHCVQRLGAGRELRHPLIDLSAGGLSIRMSDGEPAPSRGRIWRHSRGGGHARDSVRAGGARRLRGSGARRRTARGLRFPRDAQRRAAARADVRDRHREAAAAGVVRLPDAPPHALIGTTSKQRVQTLSLEQIKEFERWTARLLVADFPLLHGRYAGIEHCCEHCLTQSNSFSQRLDLLRRHLMHVDVTQRIELAHASPVDKSGAVKTAGGLMHLA